MCDHKSWLTIMDKLEIDTYRTEEGSVKTINKSKSIVLIRHIIGEYLTTDIIYVLYPILNRFKIRDAYYLFPNYFYLTLKQMMNDNSITATETKFNSAFQRYITLSQIADEFDILEYTLHQKQSFDEIFEVVSEYTRHIEGFLWTHY